MRRRWVMLVEVLLLAGLCVWAGLSLWDRSPRPAGSVDMKVPLSGARDKVYLYKHPADQHYRYRVTLADGTTEDLMPEAFAQRVHDAQRSRSTWQVVLNITSPLGVVWVAVGLLGQVLFTGRMVVQWLVSEKEKKSVVPPVFWWMSLAGSTMLLVYFMWRKDPVGLLGQAFGWFIYVRNLWLIYNRATPAPEVGEDPAPEPELPR